MAHRNAFVVQPRNGAMGHSPLSVSIFEFSHSRLTS